MRSKSIQQFCEDHGVTRPTLYKEIAAGRIRIFKIGRLSRISDAAEAQYIADSEERTLEQAPEASARARALVAGRTAIQAV